MHNRLKGKAIMVIGGGSGNGAGVVQRLAAEGARICVADIDFQAAEKVAQASTGSETFALGMDIADEASVGRAVALTVDRLGGLDGVYINAADLQIIYQDSDALAIDLGVFDRTITVNLRGHLLCTRAVLPHLLERGGGAIAYATSFASAVADSARPAYAASKSGLEALMRHVAARWGRDGVTANCVAPGAVVTPEIMASGQAQAYLDENLAKTPATRLGRVEDVAAVVAMLLSDDGRWINGQIFHVNGGVYMH